MPASYALALGLATALGPSGQARHPDELFLYDAAGRTIEPLLLRETMQDAADEQRAGLYDADISVDAQGSWLAWLDFAPGEGDRIWVGRREAGRWRVREPVTARAGQYARPTLTRDRSGRLWLSYEALDPKSGQWDLHLRARPSAAGPPEGQGWGERWGEVLIVGSKTGSDIAHQAAADPERGLWLAWQSDRGGQFDVVVARVGSEGVEREHVLGHRARGDWHPALAMTPEGELHVAWDRHDGESFDVLARSLSRAGRWGPELVVADGPAFQGRAQLAADRSGGVWVLWEEGAGDWGAPYRGNDKLWNNVRDDYGPVHRWRRLRLARLEPRGARELLTPLPMPRLERAAGRAGTREGVARLGVYYERGALAVDDLDRLWVVYRHYFEPQLGLPEPLVHHVEGGWRLYARCLEGRRWSELIAFEQHQRDGLQRLSVAPTSKGIAAVWTVGRSDRRPDSQPKGVALSTVELPHGEGGPPELGRLRSGSAGAVARAPRATADVGEAQWQLFFGDLHRHTDLSLCFPFYDGSIDDAYRYAIEVAQLDFLGITDHTRDIDHGDVQSQLWWRSIKEVTRHRLGDVFFPYFAFERSHRDTDHNVISLRSDVLRNYPPPLPEFWAEIDADTFTIPHRPFIGEVWKYHDDDKRPLLEIYQGFRDEASVASARAGLDRGYHVGFIASSDHLSTSASFACVWAREAGRESIFRALQARRTYAATARIRLVFRSGGHWMGERTTSPRAPDFQLEVDGTAPLERVELVRDGEVVARLADLEGSSLRHAFVGGEELTRERYFYVRVEQEDGNRAWSSPIWVRPQQ